MQNTLMKQKDNGLLRLGGGHTTLMSYPSHKGYFKASNCKNSALFFRFSDRFFRFSLLQPSGGSIEMGAFDTIARSIELHFRFDFRRRIGFEDVARLITADLVLLVVNLISCKHNSIAEHVLSTVAQKFVDN